MNLPEDAPRLHVHVHAGLHQDALELVRDGVVAVRERRSWQRREPYLVAVSIAHLFLHTM